MEKLFIISAEEFQSKSNQYAFYACSDLDYTGRMVYFASNENFNFDKQQVVDAITAYLLAKEVSFNCRKDEILFKR